MIHRDRPARRASTRTPGWLLLAILLLPVLLTTGCPFAPTSGVDPCGALGLACSGNAVIADAGRDITVDLPGGQTTTTVMLDGSLSFSRADLPLTYEWIRNDETIATEATPEVTLPAGEHVIYLVVTDSDGNLDADVVVVTVRSGGGGGCGAAGLGTLGFALAGLHLMRRRMTT